MNLQAANSGNTAGLSDLVDNLAATLVAQTASTTKVGSDAAAQTINVLSSVASLSTSANISSNGT